MESHRSRSGGAGGGGGMGSDVTGATSADETKRGFVGGSSLSRVAASILKKGGGKGGSYGGGSSSWSGVRFEPPEDDEDRDSSTARRRSGWKGSSGEGVGGVGRAAAAAGTSAAAAAAAAEGDDAVTGGRGGGGLLIPGAASVDEKGSAGLSQGDSGLLTADESLVRRQKMSGAGGGGAGGGRRGSGGGGGRKDDEGGVEDTMRGGGDLSAAAAALLDEVCDDLDDPQQHVLRRLSWWAALLPQSKAELLTELGGSCLFLLHGDSLLLHLIRKVHVNFNVKAGLQPLVYVHLVERQLHALQSAGAIFHLVFFRIFEYAATSGAAAAAQVGDGDVSDAVGSFGGPTALTEEDQQPGRREDSTIDPEEEEDDTYSSERHLLPHAFALARELLLLHLSAAMATPDTYLGRTRNTTTTSSSSSSSSSSTSDNNSSRRTRGVYDDGRGNQEIATVDQNTDKEGQSAIAVAPSPGSARVFVLQHWYGKEWQHLIERLHPTLLLVDDVDYPDPLTTAEEEEEDEEEEMEEDIIYRKEEETVAKEELREVRRRGRGWIAWLLQSLVLSGGRMGLNVGLLQHAVYKPTKVFLRAITCEATVSLWVYLENRLQPQSAALGSNSNQELQQQHSPPRRYSKKEGQDNKDENSYNGSSNSSSSSISNTANAGTATATTTAITKGGGTGGGGAGGGEGSQKNSSGNSDDEKYGRDNRYKVQRVLERLRVILCPRELQKMHVLSSATGGGAAGATAGAGVLDSEQEEGQQQERRKEEDNIEREEQRLLADTLQKLAIANAAATSRSLQEASQVGGGGRGNRRDVRQQQMQQQHQQGEKAEASANIVGGGNSTGAVSVRVLMALRFCQRVKEIAEEEEQETAAEEIAAEDDDDDDEDGATTIGSRTKRRGLGTRDERADDTDMDDNEEDAPQQQILQFLAVGKLLLAAAYCMPRLSLLQRNHQTVQQPERQPFIREYLYAPLNLYVLEAAKTLRLLQRLCFPTSQISAAKDVERVLHAPQQLAPTGKELAYGRLLRADDTVDFFDGRFFFTLVSIAFDYARATSCWQLPAGFFGLSDGSVSLADDTWVSTLCSSSSSSSSPFSLLRGSKEEFSSLSTTSAAAVFASAFFPIDLSPLKKLIEALPLSLPPRLLLRAAQRRKHHNNTTNNSSSSSNGGGGGAGTTTTTRTSEADEEEELGGGVTTPNDHPVFGGGHVHDEKRHPSYNMLGEGRKGGQQQAYGKEKGGKVGGGMAQEDDVEEENEEKEEGDLPELIALESRFLHRFLHSRPGGALACVHLKSIEQVEEENEHHFKQQERLQQQQRRIMKEKTTSENNDEEEQQQQKKRDRYDKEIEILQSICRVTTKATTVFTTPFEEDGDIQEFAQMEMKEVEERARALGEWRQKRMLQMTGEERRRYWEAEQRRREQRLLLELRQKAKSLCPQQLHLPITLKDDHPWSQQVQQQQDIEHRGDGGGGRGSEDTTRRHGGGGGGGGGAGAAGAAGGGQSSHKEKKEKVKPMKKSEVIRMKNESAQEKKVQNADAERLNDLGRRVEALCAEYGSQSSKASRLSSFMRGGVPMNIAASKLRELLLELLLGPNRKRLSLILNLPYVMQLLKTRPAQRVFVMKVLSLFRDAYAGFKKEDCNSKQHFLDMVQLLCLLFRVCVEYFRIFRGELEGSEIEEVQRILIGLGFVEAAAKLFMRWKVERLKYLEQQKEQQQQQAETMQQLLPGVSHSASKHAKKGKHKPGAAATLKKNESDAMEMKKAAAALEAHIVTRAPPFDYRIKPGLEAEVQLRFMGGDFTRTTGSGTKKDSRVLFVPDYWQVQLLDIIDRHESAFVTAPTSSGKTFICFYAMEKALQFDDIATVVYVSPSKALADQVYAEIYGRFSSKTFSGKERHVQSKGNEGGSGGAGGGGGKNDVPVFVKGEIGVKKMLSAEFLNDRSTPSPLTAQVVVTLPFVLEMLLMSGTYQYWASSLKYVILDEIHCISQDDGGGGQWERLVQLLPCPFLAMSATVGNPDSFLNWMRRASPEYPVTHVDYRERYSDLHMSLYHEGKLVPLNPVSSLHYDKIRDEGLASDFYVPPLEGLCTYKVFSSILGKQHLFSTTFDPPFYFMGCWSITKRQYRYYWYTMRTELVRLVKTRALDAATFAAAQQTLQEQLQDAWADDVAYFEHLEKYMSAVLPSRRRDTSDSASATVVVTSQYEQRSKGKPLDNTQTAGELVLIKRKHGEEEDTETEKKASDDREHEKDLKMKTETKERESEEQNVEPSMGKQEKERRENYLETLLARTQLSKSYLNPDNLIALCRQLDAAQMLPCLIFNFFRHEIRMMGVGMATRLKDLQMAKYYGTEEAAYRTRLINKKRLEQYQAAVAQRVMQTKMRGLSWQQREAQGLGKEEMGEGEDEDLPPPPVDIAEEVDEEYSFASLKALGTNYDDVNYALDRAKSRSSSSPTYQGLLEGLRRGVGVYDAGLPRAYREAVDILFRIGYLRICICSNALALGMNLPCRTSVFAGDAFVLTPTLFKQSAGRAGRRGFDAKGHVVLWEIPFSKINRILEARLPVFGGDFPVTPMMTTDLTVERPHVEASLSHRNTMESQGGEDEERVVRALRRLFLQPLFSVSPANTQPNESQLQHLRFYVRYHFRFMCDLLSRLGLLHDGSERGGGCRPSIWGFVVELLYESGTPSFLFHYLIFSGVLQRHLEMQSTDEGRALLLLRVLALCVGQEPVHSGQLLRHRLRHKSLLRKARREQQEEPQQNRQRQQQRERRIQREMGVQATSAQPRVRFKPLMTLLPEDLEAAIYAYNRLAFSASLRCLRSACGVIDSREGFQADDFRLPFTGTCFSPQKTPSEVMDDNSSCALGNNGSSATGRVNAAGRCVQQQGKQEKEEENARKDEQGKKFGGKQKQQLARDHDGGEAEVAGKTTAGQEQEATNVELQQQTRRCEFLEEFAHLQLKDIMRSPFSALAGRSDSQITSVEDLRDNTRPTMPFYPETMCATVECQAVKLPYWDGHHEISVACRGLNSYLIELFISRTFYHVTQQNEISPSRIWFLVGHLLRALACLKRVPWLKANKERSEWELGADSALAQAITSLFSEVEGIFKEESA